MVDPPWTAASALVEANRQAFSSEWTTWRDQARREAVTEAAAFTAELTGRTPPLADEGPLIVDGHQPELFHPGVWAKNFAIDRLARRCRGAALHLIVDNDILTQRAIRVPAGSNESPHLELEAFDHPQPGRPWEEARVSDRDYFAAFGERLRQRMRMWDIAPLATTAWQSARERLNHTDSLVDCLTAARVVVERSWGLQNLELPVSRLCATPAFHRFAAMLMNRVAEVAANYNSVVRDYRRVNRVRSKSHPVPDLAVDGDWHETPFRIWRTGDHQRQRPFVRRLGGEFELRARHEVIARWPNELDAATAALAALAAQGIRLRPRALTLTLFARLLLADLFVHGIGGAKYDEMTDALAARLFGAPPPPFLTVTATAWLPLGCRNESANCSADDIGRATDMLRQLQHNPQRFVESSNPVAAALSAEKQSLLAAAPPPERAERRRRYLRLREINAELAAMLSSRREELTAAVHRCKRLHEVHRVVHNREFSWVLFPEATLREFFEAAFALQAEGT